MILGLLFVYPGPITPTLSLPPRQRNAPISLLLRADAPFPFRATDETCSHAKRKRRDNHAPRVFFFRPQQMVCDKNRTLRPRGHFSLVPYTSSYKYRNVYMNFCCFILNLNNIEFA